MGFEMMVPLGDESGDQSEAKQQAIKEKILRRLEGARESSPVAEFILNLKPEDLSRVEGEANAIGCDLFQLTNTNDPETVVSALKELIILPTSPNKIRFALRKKMEDAMN